MFFHRSGLDPIVRGPISEMQGLYASGTCRRNLDGSNWVVGWIFESSGISGRLLLLAISGSSWSNCLSSQTPAVWAATAAHLEDTVVPELASVILLGKIRQFL